MVAFLQSLLLRSLLQFLEFGSAQLGWEQRGACGRGRASGRDNWGTLKVSPASALQQHGLSQDEAVISQPCGHG